MPSHELTPRQRYVLIRSEFGRLRARVDYWRAAEMSLRGGLGDGFDAKLELVGESAEKAAHGEESDRLNRASLEAFVNELQMPDAADWATWDELDPDEWSKGGAPE